MMNYNTWNRFITVLLIYLKPINHVPINDWYLIELLVFDWNTSNELTVYKQMINIK